MHNNNDKERYIKALDNILQVLSDSSSCYKNSRHKVKDAQLKLLFSHLAHSRNKMMQQIQSEQEYLTKCPEITGTCLGKAHAIFENIKNCLHTEDALSITKEVRRGEGVLIECYKQALILNLPADTKNLLLIHLNQIEDDIKRSDLLSVENY